MNPRITFRRKSCFELLQRGPMLFTELKWRTWAAEWSAGSTKFVCSKSADYNRSFKRSIQLWQSRGDLSVTLPSAPINYGLAARLAVFTALERGQLSTPQPASAIRLYFDGPWCSVIVAIKNKIAVNLGAVFAGEPSRFTLISRTDAIDLEAEKSLGAVKWVIRLSRSGERVDPHAPLPSPSRKGTIHDWARKESFASEGVALSLRHSTPGHIRPYMFSGEQLAGRLEPLKLSSPNVPAMGAH